MCGKHDWIRVSKNNPCPICRHPDWCTVSTDGVTVCCMRTCSLTPAKNGGYIHRLGDIFNGTKPAPRPPPPDQTKAPPDKLGGDWAKWCIQTDQRKVDALAGDLGVSALALRLIGAAWAWPYDAWAFPMFDGAAEFRGIRLRDADGHKRAVTGSRQGIFIPDQDPPPDEICITEGPTDAAALLTLGIFALGRPSCSGGGPEITDFCRRHKISRVTIIADNDGPGRRGAEKLADDCRMRARIATLPAKDARESVRLGATRETIETCINNAMWRG